MGKEYGMTPTETMDRPAWQFWMDARIRAAGVAWENERRQEARSDTDAGTATDGQKEDLVDAQEDRAEQREQADGQPGLADQLDALGGGDA